MFLFICVVYANHENIFTRKFSWSTVYSSYVCINIIDNILFSCTTIWGGGLAHTYHNHLRVSHKYLGSCRELYPIIPTSASSYWPSLLYLFRTNLFTLQGGMWWLTSLSLSLSFLPLPSPPFCFLPLLSLSFPSPPSLLPSLSPSVLSLLEVVPGRHSSQRHCGTEHVHVAELVSVSIIAHDR